MNPIEQKEIRGFTIKGLITVVACTASIVITVLGTYFGIRSDISAIRQNNDRQSEINNLQIQQIKLDMGRMDNKIETDRVQIQALKVDMEGIKIDNKK